MIMYNAYYMSWFNGRYDFLFRHLARGIIMTYNIHYFMMIYCIIYIMSRQKQLPESIARAHYDN